MPIRRNFDHSEDFKIAREAVFAELEDIGQEARDEMLRVIELRDAEATGDLKASISFDVATVTGGVRLRAGADAKPGSNVAPYAGFVDQPTRPHFPPIRALERWARAKFGATGEQKTSIAWGAARSIARRGTRGVRFTDAAVRELRGTVAERLEDAIASRLE